MGSAEMQCLVCEAAPRAGVLFLEELYGDLLQASVSLIREHLPPPIHPQQWEKAPQEAFVRGF